MWNPSTELRQEQRAPAVVQRLGGAARELLREVDIVELAHGRHDPNTRACDTGMEVLKRGLAGRFGQFPVEASTRIIIDMITFERRGSENVDEALSRFVTLRAQVRLQAAGFELPTPVTAWLLWEAMRIPRPVWPPVLQPWNNRMPQDDAGLRALMDSIRSQGQIADHPSASWIKDHRS